MHREDVIIVNNIYKAFKINRNKNNTIKDILVSRRIGLKTEKRKILNGISFTVKKGEAIGLIGKNGCGKSTTLKLLTKILQPDSGEVIVKGRVASLIELGAGFHPDMTGRENVYINASIFGIKKKEIDKRMADIIDFSELGDFIDEPVKTYSSGMYMRLAFSVAVNVQPDILLIDEILAVGDAKFQKKCLDWLESMKKKGVTIVIVSHSQDQVERICDRAIWIDHGRVVAEGRPHEVAIQYFVHMQERGTLESDGEDLKTKSHVLKDRVEIFGFSFEQNEKDYDANGEIKTKIVLHSDEDLKDVFIRYEVKRIDGEKVGVFFSQAFDLHCGVTKSLYLCMKLGVIPEGDYYITVVPFLCKKGEREDLALVPSVGSFAIKEDRMNHCGIEWHADWRTNLGIMDTKEDEES